MYNVIYAAALTYIMYAFMHQQHVYSLCTCVFCFDSDYEDTSDAQSSSSDISDINEPPSGADHTQYSQTSPASPPLTSTGADAISTLTPAERDVSDIGAGDWSAVAAKRETSRVAAAAGLTIDLDAARNYGQFSARVRTSPAERSGRVTPSSVSPSSQSSGLLSPWSPVGAWADETRTPDISPLHTPKSPDSLPYSNTSASTSQRRVSTVLARLRHAFYNTSLI